MLPGTVSYTNYVVAYENTKAIPIPRCDFEATLVELEEYYETLDLYYAFHTSMGMVFDSETVSSLKKQTSEHINHVLYTRMKDMVKTCKWCGKILQWDFPFSICEKCYYLRNSY